MAGSNTAAWVIIVLLIVFIVASGVWLWIARNNLIACQSTESPLCPSYYCARTHEQCVPAPSDYGEAGASFRLNEDGTVQCQNLTLEPTVTNVDPAERSAWRAT